MFIGWLTCIPAVLLPHSLCRSTTANAPANRQMPIASVVSGHCTEPQNQQQLKENMTINKNRLEAFSDGVLAIIITIMVLEIKPPHSSEWSELQSLIPILISYLLSFLFIGIYWGNHHHLLYSLKTVTSGIIWANLNLLFWLSLIPIATGWMGENHFASNTVLVYAILLLICGIAFTILQKVVEKNTHDLALLKIALKNQNKKAIVSIIGYSLAIVFAYINPVISGILFFAISIMWIIPDKNIEKALKKE